MLIRSAAAQDAAAVAAIYDWYAQHTAITFAAQGPTSAEFAARMADTRYPFFVAEEQGSIAGFIYAAPWRTKEAYRWGVELTVYLAPGHEGRGAGSLLMARCLETLTAQGYLAAYSCVTLPNPRSIGLHRRFGFEETGIFRRAGWKLGQWHDVVWLAKQLGPQEGEPAAPRRITEI